MTDREDINQLVVEEWINDTEPRDRVRSVMRRTYDPQSTERIADRARVPPIRAEHILADLSEAGFVSCVDRDEETRWHRSFASISREYADRLETEDAED